MKEPIGIRDYTIHGTELEPFHIYHQNYIHGGLQVPFHWHKEIEIIWVEQGPLELTLGTQHKVLKERDFCNDQQLRTASATKYWEYRIYSSRTGISSRHALFFLSRSESAVFSEAAAVSSTSASFLCIRKSSLRIIYSQNISGDSS